MALVGTVRRDTTWDRAGSLQGEVWRTAVWSGRFVDMVSGEPGLYDTRVACVATSEGLLFGMRAEDPFPAATLRSRDDLVFRENDLEIFLDFGHCYYEFEVNVLGTIYEVLHVWRDALHEIDPAIRGELHLDRHDVFTFAGDYDRTPASFWTGTHPRGVRIAWLGYDFPGLEVSVGVDGEVNSSPNVSNGWSAEVLFPWAGLAQLGGVDVSVDALPTNLRVFVGRFQQVRISGQSHVAAWSLQPHGTFDTHRPEFFADVVFDAGFALGLNRETVDDNAEAGR
jgi:hypothetical protein